MRFNHFLWKSKFPDLSTVFFLFFLISFNRHHLHHRHLIFRFALWASQYVPSRHTDTKNEAREKKETFSSHLLSFVSFFLCCYLGGVLMKPIYSVKLCAFEQISIKKSKGFINKKKRMKKRRTEVKISINVTHPSCLAFVLLSV